MPVTDSFRQPLRVLAVITPQRNRDLRRSCGGDRDHVLATSDTTGAVRGPGKVFTVPTPVICGGGGVAEGVE
ncbi:hypothetical protein GCM10009741_05090 [Kribbella lupini]|uniref:Uncharacterized protein n=1 Tax=Kribbella lupini TaxID=291602 RepID=A0ABP4KY39_9ACTN